ncbi:MAG: DUF2911 domain-containing protein [Gemmatimonadaceae bacterium]|nr:DUF2911 domain-containing protein [Gemmatimonadaceae bacterium]
MRPTILAIALLVPSLAAAQAAPLRVGLSGRASAEVALTPPRVAGQPAPKAMVIKIDYGQPHARGREVPAELSKPGTVWRTGANTSTTMTTDVDLVIGSATVPKGAYSLFTIRTADGYQLIINSNTGQWGTQYDQSKDFIRVPLTARTLAEARESLQIALVPAADQAPKGMLAISWGKLELSTSWAAK